MIRFTFFLLTLISLPVGLIGQEIPKTFEERLGYAYGVKISKSLKKRKVPIDFEQFIAGFRAAAQEDQSLSLSSRQMEIAFQEYEAMLEEKAQGADRVNLEAGRTFLAKKLLEKGVVRTNSGLLYEVIKSTVGPKPGPDSTVVAKYKGTLVDGSEFDSSDNQPGGTASFNLRKVIRGWQEGIQLMSVGSQYRFYIPNYLGYRSGSPTSKIKPYSVLIFDVELIAIK